MGDRRTNEYLEYLDISELGIPKADHDKLNVLIHRHLRFVPGFSLAVVTEEGVFATGAGKKFISDSSKVVPETLFYISSLTKVLTALLVMQLVESSMLDIDESVYTYLPDFKFREFEDGHKITLKDLLSHTTGWSDLVPSYYALSKVTLREHVYEELSQVRLVTPSHEIFNYSSANYNLLGFICEVVTGIPFAELLLQFLVSLEMRNTHFNYQQAYTQNMMALGHDAGLRSFSLSPKIQDHPSFYPSTQLLSNALDLTRIVNLVLEKGRINATSYLSPSTIEKMMSPKVNVHSNRGDYYGLGFCLKTRNDQIILHEGVGLGNYSRIYMLPQRKVGLVLLANSPLYGLTSKITHFLLDKFPIVSEPLMYSGFSPPNHDWINMGSNHFAPYYFATNGQPMVAEITRNDDDWYIRLQDLSTGVMNQGKLINNIQKGFYTVMINFIQKKVGFGYNAQNRKVNTLVIGTLSYTQVDCIYYKSPTERYIGCYKGFLEESCQEIIIQLSVNAQDELIATLPNDSFKLVTSPHKKNAFCSKVGHMDFLDENGNVYGLKINDLLHFEKIE